MVTIPYQENRGFTHNCKLPESKIQDSRSVHNWISIYEYVFSTCLIYYNNPTNRVKNTSYSSLLIKRVKTNTLVYKSGYSENPGFLDFSLWFHSLRWNEGGRKGKLVPSFVRTLSTSFPSVSQNREMDWLLPFFSPNTLSYLWKVKENCVYWWSRRWKKVGRIQVTW